jgi:hypothetical protein
MFVVIQKIQLKKPNKNGGYKEYEVNTISFTIGGIVKTSYSYHAKYDGGHFERPHQEAFKISIHQSFRENGKVKAKQCVLGTIGYYVLAEGWGLYDYMESGFKRAAKMFDNSDGLYDLVEAKIAPLREQIQSEYHESEEYKAVEERKKVQKEYQKSKANFAKKYNVDAGEFDFCFDVFGHVMNETYLNEIIQKEKAYSSYRENSSSNYSSQDYSSYFKTNSSTYTDVEKLTLKLFYKKLAMEFHPDKNLDTDATEKMQLLNKLKDEWNLK